MKQSGKRCEMKFKVVQLYTEENFSRCHLGQRFQVTMLFIVH